MTASLEITLMCSGARGIASAWVGADVMASESIFSVTERRIRQCVRKRPMTTMRQVDVGALC